MIVNHQNNFGTNLTAGVSAGDTTSPLNSIPTIDAPYYLAFDATNLNSHYEVVYVTSDTATNVNHAALAYAHTTSEEVRMVIPAEEMDYIFSGNMTLGSLSADEKWSGIVIAGVLGATIAVGDLCYLNADDSRWELVDANLSDGYDKQLGICVLAGNDGSATEMLVYGKVRSAAFPAFTVGSPLYMSETAGDITHTAPTTADSATRKVGIATTAEDLLFNPSNDYYTHI